METFSCVRIEWASVVVFRVARDNYTATNNNNCTDCYCHKTYFNCNDFNNDLFNTYTCTRITISFRFSGNIRMTFILDMHLLSETNLSARRERERERGRGRERGGREREERERERGRERGRGRERESSVTCLYVTLCQ